MEEAFIRNRITQLRIEHDLSEYQMSLDLGKNKGYIQSISSGRALPSMKQFLEICDYFSITPFQFFQTEHQSPLIQEALRMMKHLSEEDLSAVICILKRLEIKNHGQREDLEPQR